MPKSDPPKQDGKASEMFIRWAKQRKHLDMNDFKPSYYKSHPFTINGGLRINDEKGEPRYVIRRRTDGSDLHIKHPYIPSHQRLADADFYMYEPRGFRSGKGKSKKSKAKVTKRK